MNSNIGLFLIFLVCMVLTFAISGLVRFAYLFAVNC